MSRCFTWFPNWLVLGEPNIYHDSVDFTRMGGFYLVGVLLLRISGAITGDDGVGFTRIED